MKSSSVVISALLATAVVVGISLTISWGISSYSVPIVTVLPPEDGCSTPFISNCGFRVGTRVSRAIPVGGDSSSGPPHGSVGTVMCGFHETDAPMTDLVCWDNFVQGEHDDSACIDGCSNIPCRSTAMHLVQCNELQCLDSNNNFVCDSEEGIPC